MTDLTSGPRDGHCPRCDWPSPNLHPAVQHEGEVQICTDAFHAGSADPITAEDYATFFPELDDRGQPLVAEPDRTPWPPLRPGEKVRLELEVTAGYPLGDDMTVFYVAHGDKTVSLYLPVDHPQVRVIRAEPADGVPQVGELWADDNDNVYFAISPAVGDGRARGEPVLVGKDSLGKTPQWLEAVLDVPWREVHTGPDGPIRRLMTADEIARLR